MGAAGQGAMTGISYPRKLPSLSDYLADLEQRGFRILRGRNGTFWVRHEIGAMVRVPTFSLVPPSPREVNEVFWKGRALCISFILEADEQHPQNAWLYISSDRTYSLRGLGKGTKWSIKHGLQHLRTGLVESRDLLKHGMQAFCDTRKRVGLSDGTPEEFKRRFGLREGVAGHVFFGAWYQDQLVAFLSMTDVDDWLEIEGSFSMTDFLKYHPNDSLLFSALNHYLVEGGKSIVSYGLSSIQASGNEAGLHAFKTKIGFEARPVHRVFKLHPLLRPFANNLTLWGLHMGLRFIPGNRLLKKAEGVLRVMLRNG